MFPKNLARRLERIAGIWGAAVALLAITRCNDNQSVHLVEKPFSNFPGVAAVLGGVLDADPEICPPVHRRRLQWCLTRGDRFRVNLLTFPRRLRGRLRPDDDPPDPPHDLAALRLHLLVAPALLGHQLRQRGFRWR